MYSNSEGKRNQNTKGKDKEERHKGKEHETQSWENWEGKWNMEQGDKNYQGEWTGQKGYQQKAEKPPLRNRSDYKHYTGEMFQRNAPRKDGKFGKGEKEEWATIQGTPQQMNKRESSSGGTSSYQPRKKYRWEEKKGKEEAKKEEKIIRPTKPETNPPWKTKGRYWKPEDDKKYISKDTYKDKLMGSGTGRGRKPSLSIGEGYTRSDSRTSSRTPDKIEWYPQEDAKAGRSEKKEGDGARFKKAPKQERQPEGRGKDARKENKERAMPVIRINKKGGPATKELKWEEGREKKSWAGGERESGNRRGKEDKIIKRMKEEKKEEGDKTEGKSTEKAKDLKNKDGNPGSSTDEQHQRKAEGKEKGKEGGGEILELYEKRKRLWESIRETEAEIVKKETKQQKGKRSEADVISVNTQTEEDQEHSGEDETWKQVNKMVSWKKDTNRKKQQGRSRYENRTLETANRFAALEEAEDAEEDWNGKKKKNNDEDSQERSRGINGKSTKKGKEKKDKEEDKEKRTRTGNSTEEDKNKDNNGADSREKARESQMETEYGTKEVRFEGGSIMEQANKDGRRDEKECKKLREGITEKGKIVKLEINKRKACYSEAELSFFKEAVMEGHVSQTHFTDPSLEYCYRCPLCDRVVNGENLSQSIKIHFEIVHGQSTRKYEITTNHGQHQFTIEPAKITGKCREGAQPPNSKDLQEWGEEMEETGRRSKGKRQKQDKEGKLMEEGENKGSGKRRLKKRSQQFKDKQMEDNKQEEEKKGKTKYKGRRYKKQQAARTKKEKENEKKAKDDEQTSEDDKEERKELKEITPKMGKRKAENSQETKEDRSSGSKGEGKGTEQEGKGEQNGSEGGRQPRITDYLRKLAEEIKFKGNEKGKEGADIDEDKEKHPEEVESKPHEPKEWKEKTSEGKNVTGDKAKEQKGN